MKRPSRIFSLVIVAAFLSDEATNAQLPVLIAVDVSNPAAVMFTATGAAPFVNDATTGGTYGVTLFPFFSPSTSFGSVSLTGDFTAAGLPAPYSYVGGNFYLSNGYADKQIFTTTQPAFTGSSWVNLSSKSANLPTIGSSGDIYVGNPFGGSGVIIGRWEAVPEPHECALLAGLGLVGFAVWSRRFTS